MKKTIMTVFTALFLLTALTGMVSATTLDYKITIDNVFDIYLSTDVSELGDLKVSGTNSSDAWKTLSTGSINLDAGTNYFLHVRGKNLLTEPNPAGFLGEFTLSDTTYKFANDTQSLLTNAEDWDATKSSWGGSSATLENQGKNDEDIEPWSYFSDISSDATWIWAGDVESTTGGYNNYPGGDVTYFSTQILSTSVGSPVPEPTTMLLFGVGLLGIAGVSRRKNKLT